MNIGGVGIGGGQPCRTIAEISNNHGGRYDLAIALISAAKDAGADMVKCQAYLPEELVALRGDGPAPAPWNDRSMLDLYTDAATPLEWLPGMFGAAKRFGIPLFASVFGEKSLAALEESGCPAYKISHFEAETMWLRRAVRDTGKPVILSTSDYAEPIPGDVPEFRMACPGGYPASVADMVLGNYEDNGHNWGLSSHCKDPLVAPVAVARGAKLLEFHMMLSWAPSKLESSVSLDEKEFAAMVQSVKRTEELLG